MNIISTTFHNLLQANTTTLWLLAAALAAAIFFGGIVARAWARRRYAVLAETPQLELMEIPLQVAEKTSSLFLMAASIFAASTLLVLPARVDYVVGKVFTIITFWQAGVWGSTAALAWLRLQHRHEGAQGAFSSSLGIIGFLLRLAIWTLIFLLALDNLGVDITALVAGLGIGGLAIALAVQNILGDLFASLSITLDRPFVVGDFIVIGDFMGTVEAIGIKSTRVRSLGGEQIILANADLLNSRVRNYGRMTERRVVFSIGVTYETPAATVQQIPHLLRQSIERCDGVRFDRAHFAKFGDSALEFETVYYVLNADYNAFMDKQQAIYFAILEAFGRAGIEFAYPTQKLWLTGTASHTAS